MIDVEEISGNNDLDVVLFFTDGEGEPKKLNVTRCIEDRAGAMPVGVHNYSEENRNDFLSACQKTPQRPIEISWDFSGDELDSDNFGFRDGLQFSYQIISKDNFVSAPATFSEVAYPPALVQLGSRSISSVSFEDEAVLNIPLPSAEAKRIRILFREGNTGVFKIIDEVSAEVDEENEFFVFDDTDSSSLGRYIFRYNRIYAILPDVESSKTHDNLPKKAVAQTVAGNRLMYGNYTEGYDPITTKVSITPLYGERPKDLENLGTTITPTYVATDGSRTGDARGHSIAFSIECGLDSNVQQGVYDITISMAPQRNIHLFNEQKSLPSFNSEFNGELGFGTLAPAMTNNMWEQNYGDLHGGSERKDTDGNDVLNIFPSTLPEQESGYITNNSSGFAKCGHVSFTNPAGIGPTGEEGKAVIGSNAANPLILGIENVRFNVVIDVTPEDGITPSAFIDVLGKVLEGHGGTYHSGNATVDVLFAQGADGPIEEKVDGVWPGLSQRASYDKNVESQNSFDASSQKTNLISYAVDPSTGTPCKFFIVNKFSIDSYVKRVEPNGSSGSSPLFNIEPNPQSATKRYFRVEFENFAPEEVLTCIPEPVEDAGTRLVAANLIGNPILFCVGLNNVASPTDVAYDFSPSFNTGTDRPVVDVKNRFWVPIKPQSNPSFNSFARTFKWPIIKVDGFPASNPAHQGQTSHLDILNKDNETVTVQTQGLLMSTTQFIPVPIGRWWAYTDSQIEDNSWKNDFSYDINELFADGLGDQIQIVAEDITPLDTSDWLKSTSTGQSLSRGWAEPCTFNFAEFSYDQGEGSLGRYITAMDGDAGIGGKTGSTFSDQTVRFAADGDLYFGAFECNGAPFPALNQRGSVTNLTLVGIANNFPFIDIEKTYFTASDIIPNNKKAAPLSDSGSFLSISGTELSNPFSFKTNDYHDFGVVYFDERGRPGGVNKLDSVFVKGLGDRGSEGKGSVSIQIGLQHQPPPWAKTYKIVYGGSSNTRRFIQYTAAGAFVETGATGTAEDKIYVSLNHLQESRASYAKSYGAKDVETGESLLYRFAEGDKLRVVSYFEDDSTVVFPSPSSEYTFDVIGMEIISRFQEDNPIFEETDIDVDYSGLIPRTGSFAVLRNNALADGFTASNVFLESDFWGDRCVFEIVTPKSEANDLTRPYYETGVVGDVVTIGGDITHAPQNPIVTRGDVFFRATPTNISPFLNNSFTSLISADEDGNDTSDSRFRSYYLETNSLTDVYKATAKSFGKPYFIGKSEFEQDHSSSIIYSASTGARSTDYEYTSFNPNAENNFDLPFENGGIDYMSMLTNDLAVFQNSRVGKLQVNKAITRSSDGIDTLNLSNDVLSSQRFFQADLGTFGHPESVSIVNSSAYFVDASKGVVVEVGPQGIKRISDAGMAAFFQKKFKAISGSDIRVTTGYNPDKNEVIVSGSKKSSINTSYPMATASSVDSQLSDVGVDANLESNGDAFTFAYSLSAEGFWSTEYTFNSSQYSRVGDRFISFKNGAYLHDVKRTPHFYGENWPTLLTSMLVDDANKSKEYKAISIDGDYYSKSNPVKKYGSPWTAILKTSKEKKGISAFVEREGTQYSEITRSSNGASSKSQYASIGQGQINQAVADGFAGSNGDFYEVNLDFAERIDNQHITISSRDIIMSRVVCLRPSDLSLVSFGDFDENDLIPISIENEGKRLVCVTKNQTMFAGAEVIETITDLSEAVIIESRSDVFGDSLRDKMMSITMVSTNTDQDKLIELYSVNTEYTDSKLDSSS